MRKIIAYISNKNLISDRSTVTIAILANDKHFAREFLQIDVLQTHTLRPLLTIFRKRNKRSWQKDPIVSKNITGIAQNKKKRGGGKKHFTKEIQQEKKKSVILCQTKIKVTVN